MISNAPEFSTLTRSRQGWTLQSQWTVGKYSTRVTVRTDAYDFQSSAKAEVWIDGAGWQEAATLPYGAMESAGYNRDDQDVAADLTGADEDQLLARVASLA